MSSIRDAYDAAERQTHRKHGLTSSRRALPPDGSGVSLSRRIIAAANRPSRGECWFAHKSRRWSSVAIDRNLVSVAISPDEITMGNGSSVDPCKTVYVEINGKKEKVRITGYILPRVLTTFVYAFVCGEHHTHSSLHIRRKWRFSCFTFRIVFCFLSFYN